jgi:ATP-dependent DNA helicase RecG
VIWGAEERIAMATEPNELTVAPVEPPFDDDLVDEVLSLGENHHLDCKRVSEKLQRSLEAACGFANADGGWIAFGIEDPRKAAGRDRVHGTAENPMVPDEFTRLLRSRITPPLTGLSSMTVVGCTLRTGERGAIALCRVQRSPHVHSVVDDGTFVRLGMSNKELTAGEITELAFARGAISAESAPERSVDLDLLNTEFWREYAAARRVSRPFVEALMHLGLAQKTENGKVAPTRAAVLLFAEEPASLLGAKTSIRVAQYKGTLLDQGPTPNLLKPPKTISGPLVRQVPDALAYIGDSLAQGIRMGPLGFELVQRYPARVIREALTNAVIHRDYHVPRDVHVRIFDDRIEIESPGLLPGPVTAANIVATQFTRNPLIVNHLREFPTPPNLDIGEGVKMMFETMDRAGLYAPLYVTRPVLDRDGVIVVLFNGARPSVWDQVSKRIDKAGTISNSDLRRILRTEDTPKASKMLADWVVKGLLVVANPGSGKRNRQYTRPDRGPELPLFSGRHGKRKAAGS